MAKQSSLVHTMSKAYKENKKQPVSLADVITYILTKLEEEEINGGYKIASSDLHNILEPIGDEIQSSLGVNLKFHKNSKNIHSRQVERAINDITPYKIPVRNPSFSLAISEQTGEIEFEKISEKIDSKSKKKIDDLMKSDDFKEKVQKFTEDL